MPEKTSAEDGSGQMGAMLLDVWKRRHWLAGICFLLPLSVVAGVAMSLPNVYRSQSLIEVEHQSTGQQGDDNAAEQQLQRLNEENMSRTRLQLLIGRFDLYPQLRKKASMEAAIDQMRKDVQVQIKDAEHVWGHSTVAFQVSYRGRNPEQVAQVANELSNFYVQRSQEQGETQAKAQVTALQQQIDQTKAQLDKQQAAVNSFVSAHLQELPEQERVNLAELDRLNGQLSAMNHRSRAVSTIPSATGREEIAAVPPDETDTELERLRSQLATLRAQATDQHPDVVRLKQQIAALSASQARHERLQPIPTETLVAASSATPGETPDATAETQPRTREESRKALRASIQSIEQKIYNAPMRAQELQSLMSPLTITRQLYGSLLERMEDAQRLARQRELDPFRILDPAVASRAPAGPDRLRVIAGGLVMALIFALLCVFLAEKLDTSFHSLDELRAFTRVPVLASVPNIVAPRDTAALQRKARWVAVAVAFAAVAGAAVSYAAVHDNESIVWMLTRPRA